MKILNPLKTLVLILTITLSSCSKDSSDDNPQAGNEFAIYKAVITFDSQTEEMYKYTLITSSKPLAQSTYLNNGISYPNGPVEDVSFGDLVHTLQSDTEVEIFNINLGLLPVPDNSDTPISYTLEIFADDVKKHTEEVNIPYNDSATDIIYSYSSTNGMEIRQD